jgi:biopolymer transport protein ExbD
LNGAFIGIDSFRGELSPVQVVPWGEEGHFMSRRNATGGAAMADIHLIPVMNLSGLLIALLLVTSTFISYAVINVTAPRFIPLHDGVETPVLEDLTLLVTDQGFTISARGRNLGAEGSGAVESPAAGPTIPKKTAGGQQVYDYGTLTEKMRELKDLGGSGSRIKIGAEKNITYDVIVNVMDASRQDDKGELFPDVVLLGGVI